MWNKIANLSAIATLLGVSITSAFSDAYKGHIAFAAFVFALGFLTWRGHRTLDGILKRKYPKGYVPIATFVRYTTSDGKHIFYEIFRHIQIKEPFRKSFEHQYYWTGSTPPVTKSSLQTVGSEKKDPDTGNGVVELNFKEPRFYNDTEIVHVEMQLDDSDEKSQTFVCTRVDHPMRLIHYRIELLHYKSAAQLKRVATIERRSIALNDMPPSPTSTPSLWMLPQNHMNISSPIRSQAFTIEYAGIVGEPTP